VKPGIVRAALRHPFAHICLAFVVSMWLRFVYITSRKTIITAPETKPYATGERQGIFCFWHGRMIIMPFFKPKNRAMNVLISSHRDGAIITAIIARFNLRTVRGSSSKGGASAMRAMSNLVASGDNFCITPDGPRGPRHVAANGAAFLAQHSSLPLIPVTFSSTCARIFSSWDQFMLPKPFGHIVLHMGAPIHVSTTHAATQELQQALNDLTTQCDAAVGR
jgi:lysophospholipid acyltransferase (LPLAT)-like uncharacterized protein